MDEVNLSPAREFVLNRAADEILLEGSDNSLNREAVTRRRFDQGHITQADEGHVQSARNRSGGQREGIDVLAHLLEALFVRHTETLLFIHNEQTEVLKFYVFRKKPVSSDHDVHFSGFELGQNFLLFCGATKPAQHFDAHGKRRESLLESFEVLKCKNRGRREDRHLL